MKWWVNLSREVTFPYCVSLTKESGEQETSGQKSRVGKSVTGIIPHHIKITTKLQTHHVWEPREI